MTTKVSKFLLLSEDRCVKMHQDHIIGIEVCESSPEIILRIFARLFGKNP